MQHSKKKLSLTAVKGKGHDLVGRGWLAHFRLHWKTIGLTTLEKITSEREHMPRARPILFKGVLEDGTQMSRVS